MEKTTASPLFATRHKKLLRAMEQSGLDALVINPGASLVYLTGLSFHLMERPVVVIFTRHLPPVLVMAELEQMKTADLPFNVRTFLYGEDPRSWEAVFRQAAMAAEIDDSIVGVEPRRLRILEYRYLETAAPRAKFVPGEECVSALRMRKDSNELSAMRVSVDIAQRALIATLPSIKIGVSEKEIAAELTLQLLRHGSEPEIPFSPIVSSGPNSANPHAVPSDRRLSSGDLLVIDWGATYQGYISDLTRTYAVGRVDPELEQIALIVAQANEAGRAAIHPGIPASEVDQATRSVIEAAGYGKYFTHRTGHGIGMESHEEPYIRAGNEQPLKQGMTFTVEPGIYLPNRNGVRIEDNLAVTSQGAECFSDLPRTLERID